ncbi:hypothetical protein AB0K12_29430 [Nonomuraea sp. NPDC049419]|uniref:hypothetical protein n=1 Tax=Nonomuraea sp. NPDC049419 TaxID=3155772 RepID=UPI00342993CE
MSFRQTVTGSDLARQWQACETRAAVARPPGCPGTWPPGGRCRHPAWHAREEAGEIFRGVAG